MRAFHSSPCKRGGIGKHHIHLPSSSALAIGALAYQTISMVSFTFVVWFALAAGGFVLVNRAR